MSDFEFPECVGSIEDVPEKWRGLYEPVDDGFTLIPEAVEQLARCRAQHEADIEALEAEHTAALAEREADTERLRAELRDRLVVAAIGKALTAAGVPQGLVRAATAMLKDHYSIEIERGEDGKYSVTIADSYGAVSAEDAAKAWLATDEAEPFRPSDPATGGGMFTAELERLKSTLH